MQSNFTFAERLRSERDRLGLSRAALADAAGVTAMSQSNYEAGKRVPDAAYLAAVAGLGVDITYVVTGQHRADHPDIQHRLDLLSAAWEALETHLQAAGRTLPPAKKRAAAEALYKLSLERGALQAELVAMLADVAA